ncbi:hypothetical protein JOF48_000842 [Arthrobacter stackebrandtii]|uniref:Uncharacterized protein n=1 Tax=Arthrobacter stackebrandtii TaxID=272161 RepID=A0ABS4YTB4_9MICC|nr:hypothetical protein [Arthrobacter stackebrandtii]MBP2412043.1 hypothetical protein [Arthrobacter stackebrandtii]
MTLTSHLSDKQSAVRQFIQACAPELALAGTAGRDGKAMAEFFGFDELTAREARLSIPEAVEDRKSHAIVAGIALDYRLRMDLPGFDFANTAGQKGLDILAKDMTVVPRGKHIHKVLEMALGFAYNTLKEKNPHRMSVARASVALAWCESIMRVGPELALSGNLGRQIRRAKDAVDLMMGIDESLLFDIELMRDGATPLIDQWNQEIAAGERYVPNPRFLGSAAVGGADADWTIGDLLVDLKTTEKVTNPWLRETLFQLLGYTLLDVDDSLGIRRVGILLPRQPFFAVWSVDELLNRDAADALPELRDEFADLLSDMLTRQLV